MTSNGLGINDVHNFVRAHKYEYIICNPFGMLNNLHWNMFILYMYIIFD